MRHLFLGLKQRLCKAFAPEDLRQKTLKKGESLWQDFNSTHPQATGIEEQDQVRLRMFKGYISVLKKDSRESLEIWLCYKIDDLEHNFCEHTTATIEAWEAKHKQIYQEHLEVIQKENQGYKS